MCTRRGRSPPARAPHSTQSRPGKSCTDRQRVSQGPTVRCMDASARIRGPERKGGEGGAAAPRRAAPRRRVWVCVCVRATAYPALSPSLPRPSASSSPHPPPCNQNGCPWGARGAASARTSDLRHGTLRVLDSSQRDPTGASADFGFQVIGYGSGERLFEEGQGGRVYVPGPRTSVCACMREGWRRLGGELFPSTVCGSELTSLLSPCSMHELLQSHPGYSLMRIFHRNFAAICTPDVTCMLGASSKQPNGLCSTFNLPVLVERWCQRDDLDAEPFRFALGSVSEDIPSHNCKVALYSDLGLQISPPGQRRVKGVCHEAF